MNDIITRIEAVRRDLRSGGGDARTLVIERSYDATREDVWDALTNPERLPRWFLPVSGDLALGGKYQIEGNAGGEILECDPPTQFKITWMYGDAAGLSEVEVRLSASADRTTLTLEHIAEVPEEFWSTYGPGATGVGYDLSLWSLELHLAGKEFTAEERAGFESTPEAREFLTRSSQAWGEVHRGTGAAEAQVAAATEATTKFYVPDPE
jgi:uncharacterized protein YndB with AHSA1/START domain